VLSVCYNSSYFPDQLEIFERSSEIIVRDFNYMSGLCIIQSLIALIFYKSCPQQLISMVFSGDFIKRLEQEISMCYSKNTYPHKVMSHVMQLNRAVCLDCPEVNVKWFQQSYMEAQSSKLPTMHSKLHTEVEKVLVEIVKNRDFLMINRVTPYGYIVDFEVTMDQYNRFVPPLPEDYHNANYNPNLNRVAVLLLNNKVLCDNDLSRIRGPEMLRMRHLEMLGYKVIHVKISEFSSLFNNVSAKIKYLKNLLQLTA
jgi:FAST kinase-like protein, subdomain 2/RAP domain